MSLSKVYKGANGFEPQQILPRKSQGPAKWQAVTISEKDPGHFEDRQTDKNGSILEKKGSEVDAPDRHEPEAKDTAPLSESISEGQQGSSSEKEGAIENSPEPSIDVEALKTEAFEAGIQEGIKLGISEGLQQAESDFGLSTLAFNQACEQLNSIRDTILRNSKQELIELVIALSEKIIRHSVNEQDNTILNTVEEALSQAVRSSEFVIYVNPEDIAAVKKHTADLVAGVNGLDNIVLKADASIERGGCKVESDNCTVDATLASQMNIISDRIRKAQ